MDMPGEGLRQAAFDVPDHALHEHDVGALDDGGPLGAFLGEEGFQFVRRAAAHDAADVGIGLGQLLGLERGTGGVEDLLARLRARRARRDQGIPVVGIAGGCRRSRPGS